MIFRLLMLLVLLVLQFVLLVILVRVMLVLLLQLGLSRIVRVKVIFFVVSGELLLKVRSGCNLMVQILLFGLIVQFFVSFGISLFWLFQLIRCEKMMLVMFLFQLLMKKQGLKIFCGLEILVIIVFVCSLVLVGIWLVLVVGVIFFFRRFLVKIVEESVIMLLSRVIFSVRVKWVCLVFNFCCNLDKSVILLNDCVVIYNL